MNTLPDLRDASNGAAQAQVSLTLANGMSTTRDRAMTLPSGSRASTPSHSTDSSIHLGSSSLQISAASSTSPPSVESPPKGRKMQASDALCRRSEPVQNAKGKNSNDADIGIVERGFGRSEDETSPALCSNESPEDNRGSRKKATDCAAGQASRGNYNEAVIEAPIDHDNNTRSTLVPKTNSFWFNGQRMYVETVLRHDNRDRSEEGGGKEEMRLALSSVDRSAWVGLDQFRIPCYFLVDREAPRFEGCPRALLQPSHASSCALMSKEPYNETGTSARVERGADDREWVSAVEDLVAAHISAEAHRQLFSWSHATINSDNEGKNRDAEALLRCFKQGNGRERDALLQWWSLHH